MFEKPETYEGLDLDALRALSAEAIEEARGIMAADDAEITDEQIARAKDLMAASAEIDEHAATIEAADAERAAEIAALRSATQDSTPVEDPEEAPEAEEDPEEDAEEPEGAEADNKKEVVVASAPAPKPAPRRTVAIAQTKAPETPAPEKSGSAVLTAAANVPGFNQGQALDGLDQVAEAFLARSRTFSGGKMSGQKDFKPGKFGMSDNAQRYGVVRIQKPENEFSTGMDQPLDDQYQTVMAAAREQRLPGGSLVAAGGWCAPSETLYDFCSLETTEGLLSIPEVTARRGGISYTKGPDFAAFLADADSGFIQTEAEAEAGTVKPCYAVECPPFEEVRLDAVGFCITAGLLTNAAYPELVRRILELAVVGHARRLNAATISRISTLIGPAIDHAEIGATTSDVLDALVIQATRLRTIYAMSPNATIEVILPVWAKEIFRSDLSRRTGVDLLAITDADINRYLGARNLSAQWVYDYQSFNATSTATWTSFPDVLEAMLYPAGTFVRLTNDVVDLDTVYDHELLTQNTYTAAFFEEGFAIANTCGSGVKVTIDVASLHGRTGAADVTDTTP
jgi:hypothetical protein